MSVVGGGKGAGRRERQTSLGNEAPPIPPTPICLRKHWQHGISRQWRRVRGRFNGQKRGVGLVSLHLPRTLCALHPSTPPHAAATATQATSCPLTTTATTAVATIARAPPPARAHAAAAAAALLAAALAPCPHGVGGAPSDGAASSETSSVDGPPRGSARGAPVAAALLPPQLHCACPFCTHDSVRGGLGAGAAPRVACALVAAAVDASRGADAADAAADVALRLADGPVGPHAFQAAARAALAGVTGGGEEAAASTVLRAANLVTRLAPRLPAWMEGGGTRLWTSTRLTLPMEPWPVTAWGPAAAARSPRSPRFVRARPGGWPPSPRRPRPRCEGRRKRCWPR